MLTSEYIKQILCYDADTGVFIWLKGSPRGGRRISGNVAGSSAVDGYIEIGIQGHRYKAHRLAWLYHYGNWPANVIDHINGDRSDNRLSNLREASQSQNLANSRLSKANTSGFKGVHLHRNTGKYQAMIMVAGKRKHIGLFESANDAHAAYMEYATRLSGEFARSG